MTKKDLIKKEIKKLDFSNTWRRYEKEIENQARKGSPGNVLCLRSMQENLVKKRKNLLLKLLK